MNCAECRGACCETFVLQVPMADDPADDVNRWISLRAYPHRLGMEFVCRCTKLTDEGRCEIYDDRPNVCRRYERGGRECLSVVGRRRTKLEILTIREIGDPVVGDG